MEQPYLDVMLSHLPMAASILDLGCGTGMPILNYLLSKKINVVGVDASKAMLDIAKANFPNQEFILQDMHFSYKPVSIPGMSERPNQKDSVCYGLHLRNYDIDNLRKSRQINLTWVIELYKAYPDKANFFDKERADTGVSPFDLRIGTDQLRKQVIAGVSEADIRKSWEPELQKFTAIREKYLIYP